MRLMRNRLNLCSTLLGVMIYLVDSKVFFYFYSVLRPFQDYFSSYETGQSVGGVKTGEP